MEQKYRIENVNGWWTMYADPAGTYGYTDGRDEQARLNRPTNLRQLRKSTTTNDNDDFVCHYCGMPATGFGPFDEPACPECGGPARKSGSRR